MKVSVFEIILIVGLQLLQCEGRGSCNDTEIRVYYNKSFSILCKSYPDDLNYPSEAVVRINRENDDEELKTEPIENGRGALLFYNQSNSNKFETDKEIRLVASLLIKRINQIIRFEAISIKIGKKIDNVTDFDCSSNNFDNLNCSFTRIDNDFNINYTLTYFDNIVCPLDQFLNNQYVCHIQFDDLNRTSNRIINFTLSSDAEKKVMSAKQEFQIDRLANVALKTPDEIVQTELQYNSVLLSWNYSGADAEAFGFSYEPRIQLKSEYDNDWFGLDNSAIKQNGYENRLRVNLSHPYARYTLRLQIRPVSEAYKNAKWSDAKSVEFLSNATVPFNSPSLVNSSYFFTENNDLYFYWRALEPQERNGESIHYRIQLADAGNSSQIFQPEYCFNTTAKYGNVPRNRGYNFSVWCYNEMGESRNRSSIAIPEVDLPRPINLVVINPKSAGHYVVQWSAPPLDQDDLQIEGYTLFWCTMYIGTKYQCLDDFGYTKLSANSTKSSQSFSAPPKSFAISIDYTNGQSSPMVWSKCIANSKKNGLIRNLQATSKSTNSVSLNWMLDCEDEIPGDDSEYNLFYCRTESSTSTTCADKIMNQTFKVDQQKEYTITDLHSSTDYRAWIQIVMNSTNSKSVNINFRTAQLPEIQAARYLIFSVLIIGFAFAIAIFLFDFIQSIRDVDVRLPEFFPDLSVRRSRADGSGSNELLNNVPFSDTAVPVPEEKGCRNFLADVDGNLECPSQEPIFNVNEPIPRLINNSYVHFDNLNNLAAMNPP